MKVYIAGKITGDPNYKGKFAAEAEKIRAAGHIALNPAELPEGMEPGDYMRICLAMIDAADEVAFLPSWEESYGARMEMVYADYCDKMVRFTASVKDWATVGV